MTYYPPDGSIPYISRGSYERYLRMHFKSVYGVEPVRIPTHDEEVQRLAKAKKNALNKKEVENQLQDIEI